MGLPTLVLCFLFLVVEQAYLLTGSGTHIFIMKSGQLSLYLHTIVRSDLLGLKLLFSYVIRAVLVRKGNGLKDGIDGACCVT